MPNERQGRTPRRPPPSGSRGEDRLGPLARFSPRRRPRPGLALPDVGRRRPRRDADALRPQRQLPEPGTRASASSEVSLLWRGFDSRQVVGRKRVLLMPPDEVFNVYLHPVDHPLDRHAMCDLGDPDFDRFPALRRAKGVSCDLDPRVAASGDAPPPARSIDQSIAPRVAGGTRSSFRRIGSTTCGNSGVPARTTSR